MEYFKYAFTSMLKNERTLVWPLFLSFLFESLFTFYLAHVGGLINRTVVLNASSAMFSMIVMFAMSVASVAIGRSFVDQSRSFGYLFKFSRLNPWAYVIQFTLAIVFPFLLIGLSFIIITSLLFYVKFGLFVLPDNMLGALFTSLLAGLILFELTVLSNGIFLRLQGRKNINFIQFLPIFLYLALDWSIVETGTHGSFYYASTFLSTIYLITYSFTDSRTFFVDTLTPYRFSIELSLLSGIFWIFVLLIVNPLIIEAIHLTPEGEERVI